MKKLFLDDLRIPKDAIGLVPDSMNKFYWSNDWIIVRNFWEFCNYIQKFGDLNIKVVTQKSVLLMMIHLMGNSVTVLIKNQTSTKLNLTY